MLKLYYYLQSKIQSTELKLSGRIEKKITEPYNSNLFYFNLVALNLLLVFLQITTDLFKFIIILTRDPGISFNIFFKQRELRSCPYSYSYYKTVQAKVKLFSFAGASTIVFVTVVVSLVTNLMFGGKLPGQAATYGWLQTNWASSTSALASHLTDQGGWNQFESKDVNLVAVNGGADLQLLAQNSSTTQTSDADFNVGATSSTVVSGGGVQLQKLETANTWTTMTSMLGTSSYASMVYDNNGNIFANQGMGQSGATNVFWKYSIASNTWAVMAPMPALSSSGSLVYDNNGNIFANQGMGQSGVTNVFWKYNITSNTWATMTPMLGVSSQGSMVYDGNGNIFANQGKTPTYPTSAFWKYNIASNTWVTVASMLDASGNGTLVYDGNGNIFASQGEGQNYVVRVFWKYNIETDTWVQKASLPTVSAGSSMIYDGSGNIYASQAWDAYSYTTGFWKYNINTNRWSTITAMPGGSAYGSLVYDGKGNIYANQGHNGATRTNVFWKYSISDNYASSGTFESTTIDLGLKSNLSSINFNSSTTPAASGTMQFQLATSDSASGPWTYLGPNGTASTYFTTSGQVTHSNLNGKRYVRYKTFLTGAGSGWSSMANTPSDKTSKGSLVYDNNGNMYMLKGGFYADFWKYNIASNTWSTMASAPVGMPNGTLAYDGSGHIFATVGGSTRDFLKYDILTNSWVAVASTPEAVYKPGIECDNNGNIYMLKGGNSNAFWRYNIASNSWSSMGNMIYGAGGNAALAYDNNGNIFGLSGDDNNGGMGFWRYNIASNSWSSKATLPSHVWGNVDIVYDNKGNMYVAQANNRTGFLRYNIASNSWSWEAGLSLYYVSLAADTAGNIYVGSPASSNAFYRYSTRTTATPTLNDLTLNSSAYPASQTLTSSPYNSTDIANIMAGFSWKENLATSTGVTLYLRSATTSAELASASWQTVASSTQAGLSTAECIRDNGTGDVSCGLNSIPGFMRDGVGDQWFQYRVALSSDGAYTPTFNNISLTYVVNATPEVEITNSPIVQSAADGKIVVSYQTRDADTNTGRTPGYVNLTLQYCTANCTATGSEDWLTASAEALIGDFGASTTVSVISTTDWTSHTLIWDPNVDFEGQYSLSDFKIRLRVDDSEGANNLGYNISNQLLLDTANPAVGSGGVLAKVDATAIPAIITTDINDDSNLYIKVGINPDFSDAPTWLPYTATTSINLTTDPDTVYVQFKDEYNNLTETSAVTPETPTNMVIRDLTNSDVNSYMDFIAWKVVTTPAAGFKQYNIWRGEGTDTETPANYTLLTTIASSSKNYYLDTGVAASSTYYYKISTEDNDGNLSYFSQIVKDAPDGQGGTDNTPPTIRQVEVVATSTQSATIEWDTDELADSLIGYSLNESDFSELLGIDTMANYSTTTAAVLGYDALSANGRHRVTLNGLTPGTTYYFKVKSADPQGNYSEDTNGGAGFILQTKPGPRIESGPIVTSVNNQRATIIWQTDIPANATVVYATSSDLSNPGYASTTDLTTSQQVTADNLLSNTKYYYYIKNQDEYQNESTIKKVENGIESYFDFTTTNDVNPPVIENVTCSMLSDTSLSIYWKTTVASSSEAATARVDYGSLTGVYASSTDVLTDYNTDHTVELSSLTASSTYYFQVVSTDINGNTATSSEYSCGTSEELVTKTESEKLVQDAKVTAKTEGITEGKANAGGGGTTVIDKTDRIAPVISNIAVSELKADSAVISWKTDEGADSFVEFGIGGTKENFGNWKLDINHLATLKNLTPENLYTYKVASKDSSGNLAMSSNLSFTTPSLVEQLTEEGKTIDEINKLTVNSADKTATNEKTLIAAAQKAMELVAKVAGNVSLGTLETTLFSQYDTIEKLANALPAPVMGGEPGVVTTATTATIAWRTDKDANSLVAYVPDQVYNLTKNDTAYQQVVGQSNDKTTAHLVKISELKPETVYHYQLRSKADLGPEGKSRDFVFTTKGEVLEISNYAIQNISDQKATFRWVTNIETDSSLNYVPYRNNKLAVDEAKMVTDKSFTTIHEITVDGFESGAIYQVELSGKDAKGNLAEKTIETYSTSKDDLPPTISQVQTESALSQGKSLKVQTVISWMTNEPTIGQVTYEKGVVPGEKEFTNKTPIETAYGKKHVMVITKFDPGSVYSFRVSATDSANNKVTSKTFTMLTPKQKESVFQLILKNFEQTFGWVGKMNQ